MDLKKLENIKEKVSVKFTFSIIALVVLVALSRLALKTTLVSAYSPIIAICIFSNAYFKKSGWGLVLSMLAIFFSDILINIFIYKNIYGTFYHGFYKNYLIMFCIGLASIFIFSKNIKLSVLMGTSIVSVFIWWMIVDFMVWLSPTSKNITTGLPLTKDFNGLVTCYMQGFPFALKLLIGTIAYNLIFFGVYSIAKSLFQPKLSYT